MQEDQRKIYEKKYQEIIKYYDEHERLKDAQKNNEASDAALVKKEPEDPHQEEEDQHENHSNREETPTAHRESNL